MVATVALVAIYPQLVHMELRAQLDTEAESWQLAQHQVQRQYGSPWYERVSAGKVTVRSIFRGPTYQKQMALTFDDGPHGDVTRELLDLLDEFDVKATFFVVGKMVKDRKVLTKEMFDRGHELANHSFSHPNLSKLSLDDLLTEYKATSLLIEKVTGEMPRYCRPPGGRMNTNVLQAASALGMSTVYWDNNPGDYKFEHPEPILSRLRYERKNGSIVLMHSGIPATVEALRKFIPESRRLGYEFVLISEWDVRAKGSSKPSHSESPGSEQVDSGTDSEPNSIGFS